MSLASLDRTKMLLATTCLALSGAAGAQYTTRVQKPVDKPTLRSTAVLEYTGDLAKPSASRLVPIAIWDGEHYQPGGLYLAKPAPLALLSGTQYELEKAGEPEGFFNVRAAATLDGNWVGVGRYQPVPPPPPPPRLKPSKRLPAPTPTTQARDDSGDRPTLHRKTGESPAPSSTPSQPPSPAPAGGDADKPTLHRRTADDSDTGTATPADDTKTTGGKSTDSSSADADRPTLHRKEDSSEADSSAGTSDADHPTLHRRADDAGASSPEVDPNRPTLRRTPPAAARGADVGSEPGAVTGTASIDPDRPVLRRGVPDRLDSAQIPTRIEHSTTPLRQMVAISDTKAGDPRPFVYHWASPEDEAKMRTAMEALAAQALSGATPAAQAATFGPAARAQQPQRNASRAKPAPAPAASLLDEQFATFELSFSSGPTVILSARGGAAGDRFVTLIAQPDFYGQPRVLLLQVSNAATLDQAPRMRLVDAADTDNDQQGELIFELVSAPPAGVAQPAVTQASAPGSAAERQYAIYKVNSAGAQQVFTTGLVP